MKYFVQMLQQAQHDMRSMIVTLSLSKGLVIKLNNHENQPNNKKYRQII